MFGRKRAEREAAAARWDATAAHYDGVADTARRRAADLKERPSGDAAGDAYLIGEANRTRRVAEANVRDAREAAAALRRRWFRWRR